MKAFLFLVALLLSATTAIAEENAGEWQNTVLTETTIKKVQEAKFAYKKCIAEQMKKPAYLEQDSRKATEEIIKVCEPSLAKMREVYLQEKIPGVVADRHLRQVRTQTTRNLLQELIFSQAARNAGQP